MASRIGKWLKAGLISLLLMGLVAGALAFWLWQQQQRFVLTPLVSVQSSSMVISRGDSFGTVLGKLRQAGIDQGHDLQWQFLARQMGIANRLKTGEYALHPALTPTQLLNDFAQGNIISYRLTVVEGWNFAQLRAALSRAQPLEQTMGAMSDAQIMAELNAPHQHPEGRFLPETYVYQRGDSDIDILRRAYEAMEQALDEVWQERDKNGPLASKEELLVLASIIEKETGLASERAEIAGVFTRRLQRGMRLQTDPTVIYGMGSAYNGRIRRIHLTTDTPYNTYTRAGLPPTPIAMPGRAALEAAAHPAQGNSLYFVALGDGSGAHTFSATLDEHNAAVRAYVQRQRARANP